ncbi:hypothetical protein P3552_01995 [Vibrio parahaemolyticus]|uniref:hypothetical protein n=1 Tax=Vibrio parahaemolyticus TaxID=670 RepID=UPI00111D0432|nr:hypothetical protein [Vibrio parahaemolyticus]MCG0010886.1 hypothetical protein [Vibrio parahaemolyticus]MDF4725885.1 hypothetical protein [Vibrio parahaemolyticus]MDF4952483.1 hypothetical protein [Vibrio parahaemolyticus]MDL1996826.1 hypothetical protein [Vibrio parahaemolyticus]MDL2027652.1 hypothetical protein [Vibrio parahaemolyticus]
MNDKNDLNVNESKDEMKKDKAVQIVGQAKDELKGTVNAVKSIKTVNDVKALPVKFKAILGAIGVVLCLLVYMLFSGSSFEYKGEYVIDQSAYTKPQNIPENKNIFKITDDEITLMGDKEVYRVVEERGDSVLIKIGTDENDLLDAEIKKTDKGVDVLLKGRATIVMHIKPKE